jgi:hypothetical protein
VRCRPDFFSDRAGFIFSPPLSTIRKISIKLRLLVVRCWHCCVDTSFCHCRKERRALPTIRRSAAITAFYSFSSRADVVWSEQHQTLHLHTKIMEMESALENIWTVAKVIMTCSPVLAIAAILIFAREDEETEVAKRKIKCSRS